MFNCTEKYTELFFVQYESKAVSRDAKNTRETSGVISGGSHCASAFTGYASSTVIYRPGQ